MTSYGVTGAGSLADEPKPRPTASSVRIVPSNQCAAISLSSGIFVVLSLGVGHGRVTHELAPVGAAGHEPMIGRRGSMAALRRSHFMPERRNLGPQALDFLARRQADRRPEIAEECRRQRAARLLNPQRRLHCTTGNTAQRRALVELIGRFVSQADPRVVGLPAGVA